MLRSVIFATISSVLLWTSSAALAFETPTQECVNGAADVRDVQELRGRAPIRLSDQTFAMLTNSTKVSANDRVSIKRWAEIVEQCHNKLANEARKTLSQPEIHILERDHRQFLILLADLYNGNITFRDFAKRRAELNLLTSSQITAIAEERQRADDQRAQQRALERAQALGGTLSPAPGYIPIQPYNIPTQPYLAPLPPTTTCYTDMVGHTRCNTR